MDVLRCPIVELRQYTLHPGQREALITLFDREFVESQEELGMTILGQFRDLDNRLSHSDLWQDKALPRLSRLVTGATERLRLAPTARSLLR